MASPIPASGTSAETSAGRGSGFFRWRLLEQSFRQPKLRERPNHEPGDRYQDRERLQRDGADNRE